MKNLEFNNSFNIEEADETLYLSKNYKKVLKFEIADKYCTIHIIDDNNENIVLEALEEFIKKLYDIKFNSIHELESINLCTSGKYIDVINLYMQNRGYDRVLQDKIKGKTYLWRMR